MILKPDFKTYVVFNIIKFSVLLFFFTLLFFAISFILFRPQFYFYLSILALTFIICLFVFLQNLVRFNKENYEILDDRLKVNYGGIFSNTSAEILYKNIIKLSLNQPYIEHKLFKAGYIEISSAATSTLLKFNLNAIYKADSLFSNLQQKIQHPGFKLQPKKLIYSARPKLLGVIINILADSSIKIAGIVLTLYYLLTSDFALIDSENMLIRYMLFAIIISSILFSSFKYLISSILKFLDISKREYRLYADCIYYHDGFLTKTYHLIPLENLTDTATNQNMFQNLLGIYNIIISAKGVGNQIIFEYMENGEDFERILDGLIKPKKSVQSLKLGVNIKSKKTISAHENKKIYKQNIARALIGFLITLPVYILIPIFLIFFIKEVVKVLVTKYYFDSDTISEEFRFLQNHKYKFNISKITTFKIKKNLLDKMFNTYTLSFTSYGSSRVIEFKNLDENPKEDPKLVINLIELFKYDNNTKPSKSIHTKPQLYPYLIKNLVISFVWLFTLFAMVLFSFLTEFKILLVVVFFGVLLYIFVLLINWFKVKSQKLNYYDNFITFERGILVQETTFLNYDDIKDTQVLIYPATSVGDLTLNIAGEAGETINEEGQRSFIANELYIPMLADAAKVHNNFDEILTNNKFTSKKIIEKAQITAKPHILNSTLLFIVLPFLWPLLPFVLLNALFTSYTLTDKRIIKLSGVIFKSRKTVLLSKIDFIDTYYGLINQFFKTGNVVINTAGSSKPEIVLENIPDFGKIAKTIKKGYK